MSENYDIFTDGSHLEKNKKMNGRLGCGGVLVCRGNGGVGSLGRGSLVGQFGKELAPDYLKKEFGADECSNPTAEMIGVLQAIMEFGPSIPKDAQITVYADYIGVKFWMEGKWRIKEPYIKKVKEAIDRAIKDQHLTGRIKYEWVKGHQSPSANREAYWNNVVDGLAKGEE